MGDHFISYMNKNQEHNRPWHQHTSGRQSSTAVSWCLQEWLFSSQYYWARYRLQNPNSQRAEGIPPNPRWRRSEPGAEAGWLQWSGAPCQTPTCMCHQQPADRHTDSRTVCHPLPPYCLSHGPAARPPNPVI